MKKLVHSYLSSLYEPSKHLESVSKKIVLFSFHCIVKKGTIEVVYGDAILKELVLLAYLDEVTLKKLVNEWAVSIIPDIDLTKYWEFEPNLIPIAMKVASQTIALDLAPEQPLDGPKGILKFLDYQGIDVPNKNGRVYCEETFKDKIDTLVKNQEIMVQKDHLQQEKPIFISSRKKKDLDK